MFAGGLSGKLTHGSVAVVFRFERAIDRDADVIGLVLAKFRQFHADPLKVQTRYLFVQRLGQDVDAGGIVAALGPQFNLRQNLVGERGRHHKRRVTRCVAKVQQAALGQQDDPIARGHLDHVHLPYPSSRACARCG